MIVIAVKQIADETNATGLISKGGKVLKFETDDLAREWGRENIEGSKFVLSWWTLTEENALLAGHEIE